MYCIDCIYCIYSTVYTVYSVYIMCPSLKLIKYAVIHPKLMNSFSICLKICKKITFIVDVKDQRTNGLIDQPIYHHILHTLYILHIIY